MRHMTNFQGTLSFTVVLGKLANELRVALLEETKLGK